MSQALYRKYRSKSLSEIVGQEHITVTLSNSIKSGQTAHAYLFTGPRGVGKTSIARILAHEINNLPYDGTQHLDIIEIDAASNRKIDDIRDLREKVHIAPTSAKFKVYIIDEVHMLTGESFNALLKTLEEPPAHVIFILATTEVHKLPATIVSRTQRYSFRPAQQNALISHLRKISTQENIQITDTALQIIAEQGDGSFRDSISLLDQLSNVANGEEITDQQVNDTLGLIATKILSGIAETVISKDRQATITNINSLLSSGVAPTTVAMQLGKILAGHALHVPELFPLIDKLLDVPKSYNQSLKLLTVLASYGTQQPAQITPQTSVITNSRPISPPRPTHHKTTPQPTITPPKNEAPIPEPTPTVPPEPVSQINLVDHWLKALELIKKTYPMIVGSLKQSQPVLNGNELHIKFRVQLHYKKLDNPEIKAALTQAIKQITGHDIAIVPEIDKSAIIGSPDNTSAEASVAELMGGGDIIDANKL